MSPPCIEEQRGELIQDVEIQESDRGIGDRDVRVERTDLEADQWIDELGVLERASGEERVHVELLSGVIALDGARVVEDALTCIRIRDHPVDETRGRAGHREHVARVNLILGELVEAEPDLVERVAIWVWRRSDLELIVERTQDREPNREIVDLFPQIAELRAIGVILSVGREVARDENAVASVALESIDAEVAACAHAVLRTEHADSAKRYVACEEPGARLAAE